jgi:hypothetical protein
MVLSVRIAQESISGCLNFNQTLRYELSQMDIIIENQAGHDSPGKRKF